MKITKVEIEGPNGKATLMRPKNRRDVAITGRRKIRSVETSDQRKVGVYKTFDMVAVPRSDRLDVWHAAVELHIAIEGYRGTNGDVQGYVDVIMSLAG